MAGIEVLKGIGEDEGSSKNLKDLIKILSKEGETKRISSLSTEQFDFVFTLYSKYLIYFSLFLMSAITHMCKLLVSFNIFYWKKLQ